MLNEEWSMDAVHVDESNSNDSFSWKKYYTDLSDNYVQLTPKSMSEESLFMEILELEEQMQTNTPHIVVAELHSVNIVEPPFFLDQSIQINTSFTNTVTALPTLYGNEIHQELNNHDFPAETSIEQELNPEPVPLESQTTSYQKPPKKEKRGRPPKKESCIEALQAKLATVEAGSKEYKKLNNRIASIKYQNRQKIKLHKLEEKLVKESLKKEKLENKLRRLTSHVHNLEFLMK